MNKSENVYQSGQALWLDNINRSVLLNGWLSDQIQSKKIWGLTSNPSIFQKAISGSDVYLSDIQSMSWLGYTSSRIYEEIAVRDVQDAADLLHPVYMDTDGNDGYISLEVNPDLANKADETVSEAKRLWSKLNRENIFIKIPAIVAGISAIRDVIAAGINVNVTLIFSIERYRQVINAYFEGLEKRIEARKNISNIRSVASFFISRIDRVIDNQLQNLVSSRQRTDKHPADLLGKIGIANALQAYQVFLDSTSGERFRKLAAKGGQLQRPLWASTSTKNPDYPDTLYIDSLIMPDTVNTIPNLTLDAYLDHGSTKVIDFSKQVKVAMAHLSRLDGLGINLGKVTKKLEDDGVKAFSDAQKELLSEIENLRLEYGRGLNPLSENIATVLENLDKEKFYSRLCTQNETLWSDEEKKKKEIRHRLAWLSAPDESRKIVDRAKKLFSQLKADGYSHAVVLGMGGSSLAPEVYGHLATKLGGKSPDGLNIQVLDSSDPGQILDIQRSIPLERTVFIVSSKSGGTIETISLYSYFWKLLESEKIKVPASHFVAITDPGSRLEEIAKKKNFRAVIPANPDVGGRYSALIEFGLIPAVLSGLDGYELLQRAKLTELNCEDLVQTEWNKGVALGVLLGAGYAAGRDKLTLISDSKLTPIGAWIEQLVAESSGKEGLGLLPVQDEPHQDASYYRNDRIFVYLSNVNEYGGWIDKLIEHGHPVIKMELKDTLDIGRLIMVWEIATATVCSIMGVNAFDQPDVQLSKDISSKMVREYKEKGELDFGEMVFENESVCMFSNNDSYSKGMDQEEILEAFLGQSGQGDYISINAFLARNDKNRKLLQRFRERILRKYNVATTLGFGPRFLHSTGQYHKGGKNSGLFIVLTAFHDEKLLISGEDISFGALINAQAVGDRNALLQQKRRVLHIHFKDNVFLKYFLEQAL